MKSLMPQLKDLLIRCIKVPAFIICFTVPMQALGFGPADLQKTNSSGEAQTCCGITRFISADFPTKLFVTEGGPDGDFVNLGSYAENVPGIYSFGFRVDSQGINIGDYASFTLSFAVGTGLQTSVSIFGSTNGGCTFETCAATPGTAGTTTSVGGTTYSLLSYSISPGGTDRVSLTSNGSGAPDFYQSSPNGFSDYVGSFTLQVSNVAPVPEPEIYAMLGMGLGLMGWAARRRKLKEAA